MIRLKLLPALLIFPVLLCAQITDRDMRQSRNAFAEGIRKGVNNDFADAHELFNKAIRLDSLYSEAYLYRGLARIELELFEAAIDDFRQLIHLEHDLAYQAIYFSGVALLALDRYQEALIRFNEAARLDPGFSSFFHRGKAFFYLERYDEALQDFNVSDRLNPGYPEVHYYRGKTYAKKGQHDKALENLLDAKESFTGNPEFHYFLGSVLQKMNRTDEAAGHLQIAEEAFGKSTYPIISNRDDITGVNDILTPEDDSATDDIDLPIERTAEEKPVKPDIDDLTEGIYDTDLQAVSLRGLGVQMASYAGTHELLEHAARYQRQFGHPAFIEVVKINNRIRYRLILGVFESRDEALILRGRLRDQGFLDSFIIRYSQ